jgi:hypothetical protein
MSDLQRDPHFLANHQLNRNHSLLGVTYAVRKKQIAEDETGIKRTCPRACSEDARIAPSPSENCLESISVRAKKAMCACKAQMCSWEWLRQYPK